VKESLIHFNMALIVTNAYIGSVLNRRTFPMFARVKRSGKYHNDRHHIVGLKSRIARKDSADQKAVIGALADKKISKPVKGILKQKLLLTKQSPHGKIKNFVEFGKLAAEKLSDDKQLKKP
jgi:hypothetical protein